MAAFSIVIIFILGWAAQSVAFFLLSMFLFFPPWAGNLRWEIGSLRRITCKFFPGDRAYFLLILITSVGLSLALWIILYTSPENAPTTDETDQRTGSLVIASLNIVFALAWSLIGLVPYFLVNWFVLYRSPIGPGFYPIISDDHYRHPIKAMLGDTRYSIEAWSPLWCGRVAAVFWRISDRVFISMITITHLVHSVLMTHQTGQFYLLFWRHWPWTS